MQELQVSSRLFAGLNQLVRSTGMLLVSLGYWGHFICVLNSPPIRRNYALSFLKLGPRAALHGLDFLRVHQSTFIPAQQSSGIKMSKSPTKQAMVTLAWGKPGPSLWVSQTQQPIYSGRSLPELHGVCHYLGFSVCSPQKLPNQRLL